MYIYIHIYIYIYIYVYIYINIYIYIYGTYTLHNSGQENDSNSFQSARVNVGSSHENSLTEIAKDEFDATMNDESDETYLPMRKVTPVIPRNQLVRNRRPPVRYPKSEYDMNSIIIQNIIPGKPQAKVNKGSRSGYFGLKLWQLTVIMLYFMLLPFSSASNVVTSDTDLGTLFGPGHICGSAGHHMMYIDLPEIPSCIWGRLSD